MGNYSSKKFKYDRHNVMRDLAKKKEFAMFEDDVTHQNELLANLIKDIKGKIGNLNLGENVIDEINSGGLFSAAGREADLAGSFKEKLKSVFTGGGKGDLIGQLVKSFLRGGVLKDNRFDPTTMFGNINRGKYLYNEGSVDKRNKDFSRKISQLFSSVKDEVGTNLFDDFYGDKLKKQFGFDKDNNLKKDKYNTGDFWDFG